MTSRTLERFTVNTSEAHLLIVARHFGLPVFELDGVLHTSRELDGVGTINYRAVINWEVSA